MKSYTFEAEQSNDILENIMKEVACLRKLDHPNILRVYECFKHN